MLRNNVAEKSSEDVLMRLSEDNLWRMPYESHKFPTYDDIYDKVRPFMAPCMMQHGHKCVPYGIPIKQAIKYDLWRHLWQRRAINGAIYDHA